MDDMTGDAGQTRTLAHFGCLLGSIAGLAGGIALAFVLVARGAPLGLALGSWVVLLAVLAGLGYALGQQRSYAPRRRPANE